MSREAQQARRWAGRCSPMNASQLQFTHPQCKRERGGCLGCHQGFTRVKFKRIWRQKKKHMKAMKAPSATLLFQFGDYPSRPSRFVWSLAGLGWGFPSSSPCGAVLCQSGVWSVRQAYVTWVGLLGTARLGGYEQEIWSPWVFKAHYLLTVIQWSIYFFAFILV